MNAWISLIVCTALLAEAAPEKGTVHFRPVGDSKSIPERYILKAHNFDWEMSKKSELPNVRVEIYRLRFPSPVKTDCIENNTVHAEYYRPTGKGPFPGVIILDITAGDQMLSRSIATHFASNGIAGLFVQMVYYGPPACQRRPPAAVAGLSANDGRDSANGARPPMRHRLARSPAGDRRQTSRHPRHQPWQLHGHLDGGNGAAT